MRTLDEVIKANECCDHCEPDSNCKECPYISVPNCALERENDTLHFLKEFKRISARLEKIALGNITETLEKLDNPALTWDELKQMEGKPVWVEVKKDYRKENFWAIVTRIDALKSGKEWVSLKPKDCYDKESYGIDWQAYRKER